MDLGLISVRYARALLKASTEAKLADSVYAEMQTLADSYMKVPELRFTIDNPMLSKDKKEQLLTIAAGGKPCELTTTFSNSCCRKTERASRNSLLIHLFLYTESRRT